MQKSYKILNRKSMRKFILETLGKEQKRCKERILSENDVENFLDEVFSRKKYGIVSIKMVAGAVPNAYRYTAWTSYVSVHVSSLPGAKKSWVVCAGRCRADHRPNGKHWWYKIVCKKSFDRNVERKLGFSFCALYY